MTKFQTPVIAKTRSHATAQYFITPTNPISVNLIGAGGTGSQVLTALARMNHALLALNHPGFFVTVWDSDKVSQANLGRQLFAEAELGLSKAVALINRTNRFFGTNWKAVPTMFKQSELLRKGDDGSANLTISCVDTVKARFDIADILTAASKTGQHHVDMPYYWMDFGNSKQSGQVILSTVGKIKQPTSTKYDYIGQLPFVTEEYGDLLRSSETDDDTPSCSLAEALQKQDLFINTTLANLGTNLIWQMLRNATTDTRGIFLNLAQYRTAPLSV